MSTPCNVSSDIDCRKDCLPVTRKWWYFIVTSFSLFFSGLIVIYLTRLLIRICNSKKGKLVPTDRVLKKTSGGDNQDDETSFYARIRESAGTLLTAQTFKGQCFVVISFIFSISYVVLYAVEATYPVEHCLDLNEQILWLFEIGLNTFFILHFLLRFLAANDKVRFWMDPLSLVDFFTVPQVFVSIIIRQNWIGLRFLRALQLIKLADILQFLGIVRSSGAVTLAKTVGQLFAVLLTFGGLIHLLENTGNPWDTENSAQPMTYFESLYFLVVTMSTVGYGDVGVNTIFGRLVIMVFICIGLGIFATHIPLIMEYFASHSQYHGSYKVAQGRKHVVLCGYITHDTVENFLRDFLHKDRSDVGVDVVILGNEFPDQNIQSVIKKHYVHVSYFMGTVLTSEDCRRVKMAKADACLVLCDKNCSVPDNEDEENIMRVVAIKNFFPKMRVIVQLLQYHNKAYLLNIPSWDAKLGDDVVCVNELKLGFIAQSCLSPGFSTLLANIFSMRSNDSENDEGGEDDWKKWYIRGTNCELYTEKLATSFKAMTFQQAAEICFEKLNLLLIAIEIMKLDGEKTFAINPKDKAMTIQANTLGYFLAESSHDVKRALYYCTSCHSDIQDPEQIKECECSKRRVTVLRNLKAAVIANHHRPHNTYKEFKDDLDPFHKPEVVFYRKAEKVGPIGVVKAKEDTLNGSTGDKRKGKAFKKFVTEALPGLPRPEEAIIWRATLQRPDEIAHPETSKSSGLPINLTAMSKKQGSYKVLSKLKAVIEDAHKVDDSQAGLLPEATASHSRFSGACTDGLAIYNDLKENKPVTGGNGGKPLFDVTGTFYWCETRPYEDSILTREKAYDIVFTHHILVCVFNQKDDPLLGLRQLVMPLRASNLQQSDLKQIVFLGDKDYLKREWENVGSFDNVHILPGSPFCRADLRAVNANLADMVVFLSSTTAGNSADPKLADKQSVLASLNLKAMSFDDAAGMLKTSTREAFVGLPDVSLGSPRVERRGSAFGCNIPMLTEIVFDHNVQYLDIDDDDDDDMELYLSQPFACGTTFTASVLDSLVSSSYFNADILTLVRNLVTGGVNPVLEEQLAEGEGLKGGYEVPETSEIRCRCKITQISLYDGPLAEFGNGGTYGSMFLHALRVYSMICLGIYRFRDSHKMNLVSPSSKRYVIAAPPSSFVLQPTDLVFVLAHSNEQINSQFSKD